MDRDEIAFVVEGWPPAKNEAKSMMAAGHPYADRVLHLLEPPRWRWATRGRRRSAATPWARAQRFWRLYGDDLSACLGASYRRQLAEGVSWRELFGRHQGLRCRETVWREPGDLV